MGGARMSDAKAQAHLSDFWMSFFAWFLGLSLALALPSEEQFTLLVLFSLGGLISSLGIYCGQCFGRTWIMTGFIGGLVLLIVLIALVARTWLEDGLPLIYLYLIAPSIYIGAKSKNSRFNFFWGLAAALLCTVVLVGAVMLYWEVLRRLLT